MTLREGEFKAVSGTVVALFNAAVRHPYAVRSGNGALTFFTGTGQPAAAATVPIAIDCPHPVPRAHAVRLVDCSDTIPSIEDSGQVIGLEASIRPDFSAAAKLERHLRFLAALQH